MYKKPETGTLLIWVFIAVTFAANAQNQAIGLKSGISMNNAYTKNFIDDTGNRFGLVEGLTWEIELQNHLFAGIDLLYLQKGFTDDVYFTDDLGALIGIGTSRFNYDYLSIPLKAGLKRGNKFTGSLFLGIVPSLLLKNEIIFPAPESTLIINETAKVNWFDLAGLAEVSAGYNLAARVEVFTSLAYQHSLTSITNAEYFSGSKIRHHSQLLSFGIKYRLIN